jgi:hypothetical protein
LLEDTSALIIIELQEITLVALSSDGECLVVATGEDFSDGPSALLLYSTHALLTCRDTAPFCRVPVECHALSLRWSPNALEGAATLLAVLADGCLATIAVRT